MNHLLALTALFLTACGPMTTSADAGEATRVTFKAMVGTRPFACGQSYQLGTTNTQYKPRDFRLYVSELEFLTSSGEKLPITLDDDGTWQRSGVAMLDFEDKQGECSNGTEGTHTVLTGSMKPGAVHALSFTIGVPFEQNHQDAAAAQAPLNSTAMFWNWNGGYKFLKIDGLTTGLPTGHNVHVGSTGCLPGPTPNSVASCSEPNRVSVVLHGFNPASSVVVFDLAALLKTSNLDVDMPMSAPGCMSGATDADCAPIFATLGLPFGSTAAVTQRFVTLE